MANKAKDEKKVSLYAYHMGESEIQAVLDDYRAPFYTAITHLDKVIYALDVNDAIDSLNAIMNKLRTGMYTEFERQNKWLDDPKEKNAFLNHVDAQSMEDKRDVYGLYEAISGTADFRNDFLNFIKDSTQNIKAAYQAARFMEAMEELASSDVVSGLNKAFEEFDDIYRTLNNSSIYNTLAISKTRLTPEENYKIVCEYITKEIKSCGYLDSYLRSAEQTVPSGVNKLYCIDIVTHGFSKFGDLEDSMKKSLETCKDLDKRWNGFRFSKTGAGISDPFGQILPRMEEIYQNALTIIDGFKNKKTSAPYAIMHYPMSIGEVNDKYMLASLGNPFTKGTEYHVIINGMSKRLPELAKTVAKNVH